MKAFLLAVVGIVAILGLTAAFDPTASSYGYTADALITQATFGN